MSMKEKINYQLVLDKEIEKIQNNKNKPSLLLHACCAPCSSYVIEYLSNYFDITIIYYNPNIYPIEEYSRRKNELKKFLNEFKTSEKIKLIELEYNPKEYYDAIKGLELLGEKSKRCYNCYQFRMDKTASYANKFNFDYFTTTLSISPYKISSWINEIGEELSNKYQIKYLFADFKKRNGYKRSLELSKEYNLYRQDYCGCKFSIMSNEK